MYMSEVVVKIVNEDGTPKTPEQVEGERQSIIARGDTPIVPGSATDHGLLLASLQDERKKRRELEAELELLRSSTSSDISTDEGKALQKQIIEQDIKIQNLLKENTRKDIFVEYPLLKEKAIEFETFLANPDNAGMNIKTAAKAFLIENGMLEAPRKGLEKTTGGARVPPSTGMSVQEIAHLRETNFKKYQDMLEKGLIKI